MLKSVVEKFEVKVCLTREEINQGLAFRHQVFVQEKGYEPDLGNGMETDVYDGKSEHCLIVDKKTGAPVGYFRVLSKLSPYAAKAERADGIDCIDASTKELSRLLILPEYRDVVNLPAIFFAICVHLISSRIYNIYIVVEHKLAIALRRSGYALTRMSKPFELRGTRSLFEIAMTEEEFSRYRAA